MKVKKKKKKNTTRIPHTNKNKHILQLFTKHKTNVKCGQMQIS